MTTPTSTLVVGGIIAWGIYRRVRRNIGRQPLRPARIIISLVILSLVTILVFVGALAFPKLLLGVAVGIVLGGVLGFVGLRLTKFETTDQGHFFVPNMYIGLALSLLLVGRLLYRLPAIHDTMTASASASAPGQPQLFQSPLTYFILGLTIGYYLVYRIGLFVHLHDKKQLPQQ
jgi:hypothetical protein